MEKYLNKVIDNLLILNSPPPSWVYNVFIDETHVQHFYTNNQIWLLIFGHFSNFL